MAENDPKTLEIPNHVALVAGPGDLQVLRVETDSSIAEIFPHGAHVTRFQDKGEQPLLFLSESSEYSFGKAIRGGVPVIFPWFGPREGMPAHGTARITPWGLADSALLPDGSVRLHFRLPSVGGCDLDYHVTVGFSLSLELTVTNNGGSDFAFENCLHTYFHIGDIHRIEIVGLEGTSFFDKVSGRETPGSPDPIRISAETDRIYQDTGSAVEIVDPALRRIIRVRKTGSHSTVVWNPWIEKSARMPDFGDREYLRMVCVESGNVGENAITLKPGERSVLGVELDSVPLD